MLRRILAFAGLPVVAGLGLFPFFYFLKVLVHGWGRVGWGLFVGLRVTYDRGWGEGPEMTWWSTAN